MTERMSTNKMPASHGSTVQSVEGGRPPTAATIEATSKATIFDLPAEIRDEIYDFVTLSKPREAMYWLFTWSSRSRKDIKPDALAQVNRQVRHEFLSRYHRIRSISLTVRDGEEDDGSSRTRKWMEVFAESRIPMTKCFRFWAGCGPECEIRLRAAIKDANKSARFVVSEPDLEDDKSNSWFAFRGSETELVDLVDSVLQEENGVVYLTANGFCEIIGYLEDCRKTEKGQA